MADTHAQGAQGTPPDPSASARGGGRPSPRGPDGRPKPWKSLGVVYEQKFYGMMASAFLASAPRGPALRRPFAALVQCQRPQGARRLRRLARALLDRGCVELHVLGDRSEALALSGAYDALLDEEPYRHMPQAYSEVEAGSAPGSRETMADALSWFILPSGGPASKAAVVAGDRADLRRLVADFARAAGDLRERILPGPAVAANR